MVTVPLPSAIVTASRGRARPIAAAGHLHTPSFLKVDSKRRGR
jgi:hypothetical protein